MGNESGYGPNFAAISGWLHAFDPTRPIHYEGAQPNHGGFCLNGVVFADRALTPKHYEVKKVYQPVEVEAISTTNERVAVRMTNRFAHSSLSSFVVRWQVVCDGQSIQAGTLPRLEIEPGRTDEVQVPVQPIDNLRGGADYWLRLSFHTRDKTPWAEVGYEFAWEQFQRFGAHPGIV